MGRGWAGTWLVLALVTSSGAEGQRDEERWSRQTTAERRQGDWVPLSCANCRPIDQAPQGSDGLPSVLTPPPRSEDARLLPPPPPPDGLLQQAATGFIQALNQQQRKPHQQFLTETSAQSINRPQAQFLSSPQKPYVPEPSLDFQPPQQFADQQTSRQPQQLQFNQQPLAQAQIPESNPYLNQPFLLGPQFLSAPFFPPSSFAQNIQPINPTQIQPLSPISPLQLPINKEHFQVPPERPMFIQQITAGDQSPPSAPQQEIHQTQQSQHGASQVNHPQQEVTQAQLSQLAYSVNQTNSQTNEKENEEVQLLYVPVETLNQRARNVGRQKSLPSNQQSITSHVPASESNRFTSPGKDHEYLTRKPHIEDQDSFNTQTHLSKHQYNSHKNLQFQQQQPPVDQEKFNSQTHSVRQQFVKQNGQFQQPSIGSPPNFKLDIQSTKDQYNFKQNSQQQPQLDPVNFNSQLQAQQTGNFQQQSPLDNPVNFQLNVQSLNQQYSEQNPQIVQQNHANLQGSKIEQPFTTQQSVNNLQQQLPPLEQSNINIQPQQQDFRNSVNTQVPQLQIHQPTVPTLKDQPYVNQPIQFDQQFHGQQTQAQHSLTQEQQFRIADTPQQTDSPVTQTTAPDVYTTQQSKRQRFRNTQHVAHSHEPTRNVQHQNTQTLRKFPQDYQQTTVDSLKQPIGPTATEVTTQINNVRQSWQNNQYSNSQQLKNQGSQEQYYDTQGLNYYQPDHQVSSLPPPSTSSIPPPQTSPAPNQPPLSVYMETNGDSMVNDVLRLLKNAKTIQVLDTVGPDSPQVFVGPSNLKAPSGYIKFELPYLNTLENNRVERKVDTLPFFVAPLNFNPPPGYSKIPFPAPHIGSVVVSNVTILQTALHEKSYGHEPLTTVSSSERYLDQYTLPAELSPISPQLPSLINSLQDDIYSGSSSTSAPTALPETTTLQVTQYRGRGTSRGTQRGSSEYQTSPSPTRRPHSRTRRPWDGRPYSRRQPVTNPTTTVEPSTEAPVPQFTPQPEQLTFNSESYNFQASPSPTNIQSESSQHNLEQTGNYFDEHSVGNNYNQGQFVPNQQQAEQPAQLIQTQNFQQVETGKDTQNVQQYYDQSLITQDAFAPVQEVIRTTTLPSVTSPNIQQEEHTFKSQRTSGSRREPSRHHQRFRGRQRLTTTTTTESYEDPVQHTGNEYNQQIDTEAAYQNVPRNRQRSHNQQRLVENTHFQANLPVNRYNIQTERADVGVQTTERLISDQNIDHPTQQNFNQGEYISPLNKDSAGQVHQLGKQSQGLQSNTYKEEQQYQLQQPQSQPSYHNLNITEDHKDFINLQFVQKNQDQFSINQLPGNNAQGQLNPEVQMNLNPQVQTNFQQNYEEPIGQTQPQGQQNYFDQQTQFEQVNSQSSQTNFNNFNSGTRPNAQVHNLDQQNYFAPLTKQTKQDIITPTHEQSQIITNTHQYDNHQTQLLPLQENLRESSNINLSLEGQHISPSSQFDQGSDFTSTTSQGAIIQTQEVDNSEAQIENEPDTPNSQLRLVKYNKLHSRTPAVLSNPLNEEHTRRGQHQYEAPDAVSEPSTTEATTRASLVRVRGRVRGRQRAATRNPYTTTEAPNYPTTYLSRQRNNKEKDDSQEYSPRKRPNYSARQSYNPLKNNKGVLPDQGVTEKNYGINERQPSTEKYLHNIEVTTPTSTTTTTTTTEAPTTKITRRYQHILNRNKVRRVRPSDSPSSSGSSATPTFLVPTTPPPVTRLPSTRGRIRKPVIVKTTTTTTTEYPQVNSKWNEKENFAPSAGSNEILEPFYQTRDKTQQSFGFQHTPIIQNVPHKTTPKPIIAPSTDDNYWNQGVTIQQSTSFDFKPDFAAVTPPSFQSGTGNGQFQGTFSPIWNGQIELQDGNYYDVFRQQQIAKQLNDQTPFSSDQQKVIYQDTKNKHLHGKNNQYTEKTHEVRPVEIDEETSSDERVYPVYRELIKPAETVQDETSQVFTDTYEGEGKSLHEKDTDTPENSDKPSPSEETVKTEEESDTKEGPLKRKIFASQSGKKGGRRRGSWVRVRVRKPQDMFETAESQNLASLSENAIPAVTKTSPGIVDWTPEPSTEPAQTVSPSPSEPAETINFEEALKDMLKDFITNTEEEKEEVNTEGITDVLENTSNTTAPTDVNTQEAKEETSKEEEYKQSQEEVTQTETAERLQTENKDEEIKEDEDTIKTIIPEVTSEALTQQPTTILQTAENIETTIEPELTTLVNEQEYKSLPSRILGTSTTTEISLETEICYRGRCVKTKKVDNDSDLLSME